MKLLVAPLFTKMKVLMIWDPSYANIETGIHIEMTAGSDTNTGVIGMEEGEDVENFSYSTILGAINPVDRGLDSLHLYINIIN